MTQQTTFRLSYYDGVTPLLQQVALVSKYAAIEMLSKSGWKIAQSARGKMNSSMHHWQQSFDGGRRRIWRDKGATKQLGKIISGGTVNGMTSIANKIDSYVDEKNLVLTVGGRHPKDSYSKIRDGEFQGTEKRKSGVGKYSYSIIHKLNTGERTTPDGYKHGWGKSGSKKSSMKRFGTNPSFVGYQFMQKGYNAVKGAVLEYMTSRYAQVVHKAVMDTDIKAVEKRVI